MSRAITAVLMCAGINGLGALRSLATAGIRPAVIYHELDNPVHVSRLPAAKHYVPRPIDEQLLLNTLSRYGEGNAAAIPCSDAAAEFLSQHREQLSQCGLRVVIPPGHVTEILNDKSREIELIRGQGVELPKSLTQLPTTAAELIDQLGLPIIVKPRSYRESRLIQGKNVILRDRQGAEEFLQKMRDHLDAFVAQEVIVGPDELLWVCNCCFDAASNLVSAFTFQRIRMSPPHFGVTTFAIGINNQDIKEACARIGRSLGYVGPAMIEFKRRNDSDHYCYIETNPRLGMCNIFDTTSEVNNALSAYKVARGEAIGIDPTFQIDGTHFLNVHGDLLARISDGESIGAILSSYWQCRHSPMAWAVYDKRDIRPFIKSIIGVLRTMGPRVVRRVLHLKPRKRAAQRKQ